ncbi:hypothetical protein ACJW30_03G087900 [Castanea mollissima]
MEDQSAENGAIRVLENAGVDQEEDGELFKRMITGHPLYGLLIETHLKCLKVALGDQIGDVGETNAVDDQQAYSKLKGATTPTSSDLDRFMEAYCMELSRLKEGMEQPIKEAASFINAMNMELKELSGPNNAYPTDLLCTKK